MIVIQGDHGPNYYNNPEQRMGILNAFYTDLQLRLNLYPSITPINSFRLLANHYLGTNFELVEDISYFLSDANFRRNGDFRQASIIDNGCKNSD